MFGDNLERALATTKAVVAVSRELNLNSAAAVPQSSILSLFRPV